MSPRTELKSAPFEVLRTIFEVYCLISVYDILCHKLYSIIHNTAVPNHEAELHSITIHEQYSSPSYKKTTPLNDHYRCLPNKEINFYCTFCVTKTADGSQFPNGFTRTSFNVKRVPHRKMNRRYSFQTAGRSPLRTQVHVN